MFLVFVLVILPSVMMTWAEEEPKSLFTFEKGRVGVNFGGYHASAGLGGLLTGNTADGGLHAEAGTPHGQRAVAGLGGGTSADGRAAGGLYAGATAGQGVGAEAGLEGSVSEDNAEGSSYARAGVPGRETHITKVLQKSPNSENSGEQVRIVEKVFTHRRPFTHRSHLDNQENTDGNSIVTKTVVTPSNPQLFRDIFNIPISVLDAVQKLLSGISAGETVSKRVETIKYR